MSFYLIAQLLCLYDFFILNRGWRVLWLPIEYTNYKEENEEPLFLDFIVTKNLQNKEYLKC